LLELTHCLNANMRNSNGRKVRTELRGREQRPVKRTEAHRGLRSRVGGANLPQRSCQNCAVGRLTRKARAFQPTSAPSGAPGSAIMASWMW
jgi:hypothetical protein